MAGPKKRDIRGLTIDKGFGKSCNSLSLADLVLMPSSRPYPARFGDGAPVGLARQAGASLFLSRRKSAVRQELARPAGLASAGSCPPEPNTYQGGQGEKAVQRNFKITVECLAHRFGAEARPDKDGAISLRRNRRR
jgi:hypothetical protein